MSNKYQEVRRLFLSALDQPEKDREAFLLASGADPETIREARQLLAQSSPHTILDVRSSPREPQSTTLGNVPQLVRRLAPFVSTRSKRWITGVVLLALLAGGGQWLRVRLRTMAVHQAMSTVQALQESHAEVLIGQLADWKATVDAATAPGKSNTAAIAAIRNPGQETLAAFHDYAAQLLAPGRFTHYALFDARGMLVGLDGKTQPPSAATPFGMQMFAEAHAAGKTVVAIPGLRRTAPAFAPEHALVPRIAFYSPLQQGEEHVGTFFVLRLMDRVASTLSRARTLSSGESFLFTPEGLLLSPSRFESQLAGWGVATPASKDSAALVYLRDPGRALESSPPQPGESPESWERTLLLRTVLAARDKADAARFKGSLSEPYRDYRGEPVVSSWQWIPELGLGIATEVDAAEVLDTPRLVDRSLLLLLALIGAGLIWTVISSGWLLRLQKRAARRNEVGPYALIEKIGEGGMGEVYLARHALLKRTAALKLLRRDRDNEVGFRQFEREAQLVSHLHHPNTVDLYDFGVAKDGTLYFVMEYLPGLNLAEWIKRTGRLPQARTIHVIRQVVGALTEAHHEGLLHCDVKPNNVMLCSLGGVRDVVKLLDFGLAFSMQSPSQDTDAAHGGTPYYTAPERLESPPQLEVRSDIYSVGILWFYLLAGRLPHAQGEKGWVAASLELDAGHLRFPVVVDPELEQLVRSCMARNPQHRPDSAKLLLSRINALASRIPWSEAEAEECWLEVELPRSALAGR